jgi:putative resolvase
MEVEQKLYSMAKACIILGVHFNTIRAWDKLGKIKVIRSPGNRRMIPVEEINRLLGK